LVSKDSKRCSFFSDFQFIAAALAALLKNIERGAFFRACSIQAQIAEPKCFALRFFSSNPNKRKPMKPVLRYQSQLLYRRSYKPRRAIRIRPTGRLNFVFRPVHRFGVKPQFALLPELEKKSPG
jgi:hypothetical protein